MVHAPLPPSALVLLCVSTLLVACPEPGDPDSGTVGCVTREVQGITIGRTGIGWEPLVDGESLPAWQRPQGGIGTRVNLRMDGFAASADLASVGVAIVGVVPEEAAAGQPGGACRDPDDAGVTDAGEEVAICERPGRCAEDNICRLEVADVIYNSFPRLCQPDGSLLAPEVPIRFKTYLQLADVDGRQVDVLMQLRTGGGDAYDARVQLRLEQSDFIQPETFDPLGAP